MRRQAVFWLSQVGTDRAVGALDSILRFSNDEEIQERAVFALSQHDSPRAQQALRTYAERKEVPEAMRETRHLLAGPASDAGERRFSPLAVWPAYR